MSNREQAGLTKATVVSPAEKEMVLLAIISAMGGETDASDERWSWLQWFCADEAGKEADTFNRCVDKGWLKSSHDSDTDHSVAWITDLGRAALANGDEGK